MAVWGLIVGGLKRAQSLRFKVQSPSRNVGCQRVKKRLNRKSAADQPAQIRR
jgi:hypothetical protein